MRITSWNVNGLRACARKGFLDWLESSDAMVDAFRERTIPCRYDVWESPADHHERWWRGQLRSWLERALPATRERQS